MTGKNCQNCGREIGVPEDSYSYYGQVICKACMIRLEKQFGDTESTDDNIDTEIPNREVVAEQEKTMKGQTAVTEERDQSTPNEQGDGGTPQLGELNIQYKKEAIMSTDERMKKMERQLARVRWFNCCLIACIILSLGAWVISKTFDPETVRAKRFIVEDENGKARAVLGIGEESAALGMGKNSPCLMMSGENGRPLIMMVMSEEGSKLILSGENGKSRASLSA
ncbi:MAG: hypothetical protein JRE23_17005, partial [Deltaproteobacteria bacterium]|nr:hypothetical protein [Deltaproteobacteria bacterium]